MYNPPRMIHATARIPIIQDVRKIKLNSAISSYLIFREMKCSSLSRYANVVADFRRQLLYALVDICLKYQTQD